MLWHRGSIRKFCNIGHFSIHKVSDMPFENHTPKKLPFAVVTMMQVKSNRKHCRISSKNNVFLPILSPSIALTLKRSSTLTEAQKSIVNQAQMSDLHTRAIWADQVLSTDQECCILSVFVYVTARWVSLSTCCIRDCSALIRAVTKGEWLQYFDVFHQKYVQLTAVVLFPPHGITQFNGLNLLTLHHSPFCIGECCFGSLFVQCQKSPSKAKNSPFRSSCFKKAGPILDTGPCSASTK